MAMNADGKVRVSHRAGYLYSLTKITRHEKHSDFWRLHRSRSKGEEHEVTQQNKSPFYLAAVS